MMSIYVVMDFLNLLQETRGYGGGQVAFAGHLGGVLFGYLYKTYDFQLPDFRRMIKNSTRPSVRVAPSTTSSPPTDAFETRVDEILMKIAREGQSSLTDEDKRMLDEASRRARSRRGAPN